MMRRLLILSVLIALGGCQLALPGIGKKTGEEAANPIMGDAISVTSLDAPTDTDTDAVDAAVPATDAPAAKDGKSPEAPLAEATTSADPAASDTATAKAEPVDPGVEAAPAAVVEIKTPLHLACEKKGGRWSMAGSAKSSFCQSKTRDAGKQCSSSDDCSGYCLAKSRTCAPYAPLLGCNEILDDQGRALTECVN